MCFKICFYICCANFITIGEPPIVLYIYIYENYVDFRLVEVILTGILLFIFIIYIRELSWRHGASMSTLSHQ